MDKDFYSIKEFAAKLYVSEATIRRAITKSRINAFRVGYSDKSSYRIPHSEISRMAIIDLQKLVKKLVQEEKSVKAFEENK